MRISSALRSSASRLSAGERVRRGEGCAHPLAAPVILLLLTAACDSSPAAPSSTRIPDVAGVYTGALSISSSTLGPLSEDWDARFVVRQAGSQLTITGSVSFDGQTTQLPPLVGAVNSTGSFRFIAGGDGNADISRDRNCGELAPAGGSITFSGRTLRYVQTIQSEFCGDIEYSGTLTR